MNAVWTATFLGNSILLFLLFWRGHYHWRQWLTTSSVMAVIIDIILHYVHLTIHPSFEIIRQFSMYCLFWGLDGLVIWEAFCLKDRRVQIPVELQLGMSLFAALLHHSDFVWTTYYVECFLRWLNVAVILWFINIFRREANERT